MSDELPIQVQCSDAFAARLPTQRLLDTLQRIDSAGFAELAQSQPFRVVAFRALLRDFPDYDPTALWLHAYDVEVEVVIENPTNGKSPTPAPGSAVIGA
jgi:hypothetical protein